MKKTLTFIFISVLFVSCGKHVQKTQVVKSTEPEKNKVQAPAPPVIIYKTRGNYYENVPVGLSSDKSRVVSYPATKDVSQGGQFRFPDKLAGGYLLDNQGIGPESGFLKITYAEYHRLAKTPDANELKTQIADDRPFTEMYRCVRHWPKDKMVDELNTLIQDGKLLERCTKIK